VNEAPVAVLPTPTSIKLHNINWEVIHITEGEDTKVYFALSPGDYENLSLNMAEVLRWNREMKWQLRYYIKEVSDNGDGRQRSNPRS
jgi:hypothetical protein